MSGIGGDLRYAVRQLARNPGFTVVAVLALALGIGGATGMFSVIEGVLLRPLPYPEPERLVAVTEKADRLHLPKMWVALPNFRDWVERSRSFEHLAAFGSGEVGLSGTGEPERIQAAWVTRGFFGVLGVRPALGRAFEPGEEVAGGPRSLILSDGLWRRRFGGDPGVLGRVVRLDGESYTVVGVTPGSFRFPEITGRPVAALMSFSGVVGADADMPDRGSHPGLVALGRLRRGVTADQARADLTRVAAELRAEYPDNIDDGVWLAPLKAAVVEDARTPLVVLLAAVGLLLLIACATVAGLLLARGAWRERELSLRAALGASPWRLVRQLLTESVLLALIGAVGGLLLAGWGIPALLAVHPGSIPRADQVELNLPILALALLLATATGVLSGVVPAALVRRPGLADALKEGGGKSTGGPARQRLRRLLVAGQLTLAVVLLFGAGLLLRSLQRVLGVDPGFDPHGVFLVEVSLPASRYPTPAGQISFFEGAVARVGAIPGVVQAGLVSDPPLSGSGRQSGLRIEGGPALPEGELPPLTDIESVTPGYFRTMAIPLVQGRLLSGQDDENGRRVAVVDDEVARRHFPGATPVGRRIAFDNEEDGRPRWREIVGVVRTVRQYGLDVAGRVLVYVPARQLPAATMTLAVRAPGHAEAAVPAVRKAVQALDRDLAVGEARVLEELLAGSVAPRRLQAVLLTGFAAIALLLASLGTYGVVSYSAARRTREVGIRIALGARRSQVLCLLGREGATLALSAAGVGIPAALAVAHLLRSQLFEVGPADPLTFGTIVLVLGAVALLASYLPARRAAHSDPMVALRSE